MCMCVLVCMCVHVCACVCMCVHVCACVCVSSSQPTHVSQASVYSTYIHTHTYTHTCRTAVYILLSANTSLSSSPPISIYVLFNTSSTAVLAQVTSATSIVAVCPEMPRAGPVTVQVLAGQNGPVIADLPFTYVWPATVVSPTKVPTAGGRLTMKVWNTCVMRKYAYFCIVGFV
jgi:hypothetical protein